MNELALFAGAGGGILGGKLLGWRTVCAVEWEPYPASVLCARQNDGLLPPFPVWDDVQTFDGKPWRGIVDVISGGFPCQDISAAGGAPELQAQEVQCGNTWQGLLAKYDHNMSLWRTPQCLLDEGLESSLEIWPAWGMTRNGESYPRQTLEPNICEREYGLSPDNVNFFHTPTTGTSGGSNSRKAMTKRNVTWPTPTTGTGGANAGGSGARRVARENGTYVPSSINPNLYEWLMGWPQEWTDLKPLAMDKCRKWQLLHGEFLAKD